MKKYGYCVSIGICCAILLAGCGDKGLPLHPGNMPDAGGHSAVFQQQNGMLQEDKKDPTLQEAVSLVEEFTNLEKEYKNLQNRLQKDSTQSEMNLTAKESAEFWQEELDSLLNRLKENVTEEDWKFIQKDQQTWSEQRDADVANAGREYEGGSMQPLVENTTAAELNRARCYILAGHLASYSGEAFSLTYPTKDENCKSIVYADKQGTRDVYSELVMELQEDGTYAALISLHRIGELEGSALPTGEDTYTFLDNVTGTKGEIRINRMEDCAIFEVTECDSDVVETGMIFEFPDHE